MQMTTPIWQKVNKHTGNSSCSFPHKIMASGPFISWQIKWEKVEVSFNFMAAVTICSDFGAQKNKV